MLFNSLHFALFFPVVALLHFLLPYRYRWMFLLAASYYFYMAWIPKYVLLLMLSTLVDYTAGLLMGRTESKTIRRRYLCISLAMNLGMLFFFKYFNFFNENLRDLFEYLALPYNVSPSKWLLPVGISFYTFQTVGYAIDVYRGQIKPEKHLGIFALYVSFFPQLVAGPIERAGHLLPQFRKQVDFDYGRVTDGLKLVAWGLFKKVVIADRISVMVDYVYGNPYGHQGPGLVLASLMFAWQIYCDFSGYSDIAVGTAQILGYDLMQNFRQPYLSRSIPELWRRWHISLTTWFRDYVFISLGGTRVSAVRSALNLLTVFFLCGLWHGAKWTFVIWGLGHGIFLVSSMLTRKPRAKMAAALHLERIPRIHAVWQVAVTFSLFFFIGVFFRAENVPDALYILRHFFSGWGDPLNGLSFKQFIYSLGMRRVEEFHVAMAAIVLLETVHFLQLSGPLRPRLAKKPFWFRWALYYGIVLVIMCYGVFNDSPFIYFQF
ncbi:MAG: hypothetical protein QG656_836 [Candidatus Hydrogenedentes bacterium]|nr:hypothetical protein [Candidatus Hydrogenedentota bacterium]